MALFDTLRWTSAHGEGPQMTLTPEQQVQNIQRVAGMPDLTEAGLLRMVAGAADDDAATGLLSSIRKMAIAGTGYSPDGGMSHFRPQDLTADIELLQGASAPKPQAAPEPETPATPTVPGQPRLGQGYWDGNTFMPPTDPAPADMQYPRQAPSGFPLGTPAALQQPAMQDYFGQPGGGRLLQQMAAARPRLLGGM